MNKDKPSTKRIYLQTIDLTKRPLSRIYNVFSKLNSKETSNPSRKWAKETNRYFPKEDTRIANKPRKRRSTTLATKEMQFKIIMRFHYILLHWQKIKISDDTKCQRGFRET